MKLLIKLVFTAVIAYLLQWYLPWWSVVIAGFLVSLILSSNGLTSFISGFLGVGIYWFILAYMVDSTTNSILTERVSAIFFLPNSFLMILLTAAIGGLVGGLGALTGGQLRELFRKTRKYKSIYHS